MTCPNCGNQELHPTENAILIRALKVFDEFGAWSQCLVCSGGYDENLVWHENRHNPNAGWFN